MKSEAEAKALMLKSRIFQNCWGQPHKRAHTMPKARVGRGKGEMWFEMYKEISEILPEVKTILNIGVGFKKGMNNESVMWMKVYDEMFGPIDRFANVDILPTVVEESAKAIKSKRIKGRAVDYLKECYRGNVKTLVDIKDLNGPFDMIVWSHGPEHVYRDEWRDCFDGILKMAKVVVIQLPWGCGYNSEPTHFSPSVRCGELEEFGFRLRYVGVEDTMQACMYGWRLGDIPC